MGNYLHGRHSSSGDARLAGSVSVRDLVKRYDSVIAVAGECSEVRSDEFLALLGPSGSGKTTILMNIAGFDFPDSGSIEIGGCDATWMSPDKRELGMAFQRYTLFPRMSALDNIAFPLSLGRPSHGASRRLRRPPPGPKPQVAAWWTRGDNAMRVLRGGDALMSMLYSGRAAPLAKSRWPRAEILTSQTQAMEPVEKTAPSHASYSNNVSQATGNVLRRFLDASPI
jgi:ABC-type sugar transport system ATPase subunit